MCKFVNAALIATLALTIGSIEAKAASHSTTIVKSTSNFGIWVTYYGAYRNKLGYACIPPKQSTTMSWSADDIFASFGAITFRYEIKANKDCTGKTTFDSHYNYTSKMPSLGDTLRVETPAR